MHMVVTRLCAKFRHRTTRRLGADRPRQNKETLEYSVDEIVVTDTHRRLQRSLRGEMRRHHVQCI